jgi:hypothetical protein
VHKQSCIFCLCLYTIEILCLTWINISSVSGQYQMLEEHKTGSFAVLVSIKCVEKKDMQV